MSDPAFYDLVVTFLGLVERIMQNYEAIGGPDKTVYLEIITVGGGPYSRSPRYKFLAGKYKVNSSKLK